MNPAVLWILLAVTMAGLGWAAAKVLHGKRKHPVEAGTPPPVIPEQDSGLYEIGGQRIRIGELTVGQMQKLVALQMRKAEVMAEGEELKLILDSETLAELLSIVATDEAGREVKISTEEVSAAGFEMLLRMANDFFARNPSLTAFAVTSLRGILLNSGAEAGNMCGKAASSGSMSPVEQAVEILGLGHS
jgi:hypothetical protein